MTSDQKDRHDPMTNIVLLNNVDHHDLRVITRYGPEFGDTINQLLVFPTEFEAVQREYPIVFRHDQEGNLRSVALLGFARDENLYLGEGGWQARYVPAIQQRGPFSIALQEQIIDGVARQEPMIRVDLDHPRVSRTEGINVFLPHGGNSPWLDHITGVLRTLFTGNQQMAPMFAAFEAAGLIRPVNIEVEGGGQSFSIPDVFTIDEERLAGLAGAELEALHRSGFLRAAIFAAASLGNIARLIELRNRKG